MVTIYLANQLGFSETGRYVLDHLFIPRLKEIGFDVFDPFVECGKLLDLSVLEICDKASGHQRFWEEFNRQVGPTNNKGMIESDCMGAILDGGHALDDGVSGEIGFYAGREIGPIFALRSDLRLAENLAAKVNPQITSYIEMSGGKLIDNYPNAIETWFDLLEKFYETFTSS